MGGGRCAETCVRRELTSQTVWKRKVEIGENVLIDEDNGRPSDRVGCANNHDECTRTHSSSVGSLPRYARHHTYPVVGPVSRLWCQSRVSAGRVVQLDHQPHSDT